MRKLLDELRRRRLVTAVERRFRVERIHRSYVDFLAVSCSRVELETLDAVCECELARLESFLSHRLGAHSERKKIAILCLGADAEAEAASFSPLQPFPANARGRWYPRLRVGIVRIKNVEQTRRTLVHEIAHGLIDEMTHHFRFPPALEEGLVGSVEWTLPDSQGLSAHVRTPPPKPGTGRHCLREGQCVSIRELLAYRQGDLTQKQDMRAYSRMAAVSMWFNVFLSLERDRWPEVESFYETVWKKRMRNPRKIYRWLLGVTQLEPETLEASFKHYCLTATKPGRSSQS